MVWVARESLPFSITLDGVQTMFVIYGQFWNQTRLSWDWQQIGGTPTNREDAHEFAHGFAQSYNVPTKVVTRLGTTMFLPPVADEGPRR